MFWWSAAIGLISFLLFGLCLETFDPDGESFLTTILAFGFFFGFVTAVCALVYLVVQVYGEVVGHLQSSSGTPVGFTHRGLRLREGRDS